MAGAASGVTHLGFPGLCYWISVPLPLLLLPASPNNTPHEEISAPSMRYSFWSFDTTQTLLRHLLCRRPQICEPWPTLELLHHGRARIVVSHLVLRSKPDAHRIYAQDQVVIHTVRI
jgi:hypothetical protein